MVTRSAASTATADRTLLTAGRTWVRRWRHRPASRPCCCSSRKSRNAANRTAEKSQKCWARSKARTQWNVMPSSTPHRRVRRASRSRTTESSTVAAPTATASPRLSWPSTDRTDRPREVTSWSWYRTAQLVVGSKKPVFSLENAANAYATSRTSRPAGRNVAQVRDATRGPRWVRLTTSAPRCVNANDAASNQWLPRKGASSQALTGIATHSVRKAAPQRGRATTTIADTPTTSWTGSSQGLRTITPTPKFPAR